MRESLGEVKTEQAENFFRGAFSIDMVLFTFKDGRIHTLLERKKEADGLWGFPGKLMSPSEEADEAMDHLMKELLGTFAFYKKDLQAFTALDRHPDGRVITIAYYGLVDSQRIENQMKKGLQLFDFEALPKLGFDHDEIFRRVKRRLQKALLRHPVVFEMLPEEFIIRDIIHIYEQAFGQTLDGPNFRKQVKASAIVVPTGRYKKEVGKTGRPAEYFRFDQSAYRTQKDKVQFNF